MTDGEIQAPPKGSHRWKRWLVVVSLLAILLGIPFIFFTDFPAHRLDLTSPDQRADLEKWVGVIPRSGVAYSYATGFVDRTLFYKLRVTSDEAAAIIGQGFQPSPRYDPPRTAPYWWHPKHYADTMYFATASTFPNHCIYERNSRWIYLQIEL
jgi:hypothetical protein